MVVSLRLLGVRDFNMQNLNQKLEELGEPTFRIIKKTKDMSIWRQKVYRGRVELTPMENTPIVHVRIRGKKEDMVTGAFIGWLLRNMRDKVLEVDVWCE